MENTILYYDILSNDLYDEAGNLFGNRILDIFLNNHMNLEVHYVALDGSQTDDPTSFPIWNGLTGVTVASSVAVDNNMQHAIKGTLAEELSIGSVSSIKVTATSTTINPTGTIVLIDSAGERLGVPYSAASYANGVYTFTVSVSLDQAYPVGSTVRVPEALIMKAEGDDIDDSRASQGIFVFKLYALSHKLIELLDYSNTSSISATMQHKIISEGEVVRTFEYELTIRNVLEFENDSYVPAAGPDEVATKSWVLSFYRSPFEYQFSVDKSEWHDTQTDADRYYRQRIKNSGSDYSDPIAMIVGPKGDAGTTPSINSSNNHWMLGDTDTGVSATGPAGTDGLTPSINADNKHWIIGTQDTGIVAEGKDGVTPHIGENGNWFIGDTDTGVNASSSYTLPTASSSTLGGVKVGNNLSISEDGTLSANASQYELPIASTSTLGGIKISSDFTIDEDGTLHTTSSGGSGYVLPVATASTLGGVKQGTNVTIAADGTLSATDTTYSVATTSQDGLMSAADKTKLDGIDTTGSSGDMLKSVYDTNDDGIVDHAATADTVGTTTAAQVADAVGKAHTHANKATLDKLAEADGKLTFDGSEIGGGSGTVKSVNGQLPDESGNVTIETNAFGEWINFEPSGQVMLTHNFNDRFAVGILQLLDDDGHIYSLNDRVTYNTNYINIDYTGLLLTGTHKARFFNSSASMGGLKPPAGALALYENYSGGNWADSSGNGYDLTASGSITAQNGEAFFPDATGKLLAATNWPLGNNVTFSVVVSAQDRVCWFGCSKGILGIYNNGFTFGKTDTLYGHSAQIPTAVLSGKFHLLMTLNGTSVQYYLNGEQMKLSDTDEWSTATVDGLGNVYTKYPFTSHTIAHCAIYNSILTAEDISKCWNYVKAKYNL